MSWEKTIGIDLSLEGKHVAVVCNAQGQVLNQKAYNFSTNLDEMEKMIEKFIPQGVNRERVAITMEPTSNAWITVSAFFISKGFSVYLIKTQKAHALREFYKKHAKTDRIDARTLAKMPFVDAKGLNKLILSGKQYYKLEKFIKERENMIHIISAHKNRIYAHFQILNPRLMSLFGGSRFTRMARALYRKYANPLIVEKSGFKKFSTYLNKKAFGIPREENIKKMFDTTVTIAQLHKSIKDNYPDKELPYDLDCIQDLVKEELDVIEFFEQKCKKLEKEIKKLYDILDSQKVLSDIKGFGGDIIAPAIIALTGLITRFKNVRTRILSINIYIVISR